MGITRVADAVVGFEDVGRGEIAGRATTGDGDEELTSLIVGGSAVLPLKLGEQE
jgi:hypothetical protein